MFVNYKFTGNQIKNYFNAAARNFKIAADSAVPEVIFKFSYDALIKLAISICAKNGLRVKSRVGHHIELLEKMAQFLGERAIFKQGDEMRKKRNQDLYGEGVLISEKEAGEYRDWLKNIFIKAEAYLSVNSKLF